jgi:hypothetical protein
LKEKSPVLFEEPGLCQPSNADPEKNIHSTGRYCETL